MHTYTAYSIMVAGGGAVGTPRTRANNKYNAKAYDRIALQVKKGRRAELQEIAGRPATGRPKMSLNAFINEAIEEKVEREKLAAEK